MVTPESSLRSPFAEKVLFAGIVANSPNDMYCLRLLLLTSAATAVDDLLLHSVRHARFLPALGASSGPEPGEGAHRCIRV